ncbi:serine O-acetyltransferase [Ferruginibacter yonginensis]|uniref:Serine acetyltransferase n=1 Tax=Ferruginibacter yonginensis TaxID=1310416 RepID=A0ABV8QQ15_9BACT
MPLNEIEFLQKLMMQHTSAETNYPNKINAAIFIDALYNWLFTPQIYNVHSTATIHETYTALQADFLPLLQSVLTDEATIHQQQTTFFNSIPNIYEALLQDAESVLNFDPAAISLKEVLLAYPGFYAVAIYRFAHQLQLQGVPILPRLWSTHAHSKTGIDIHPAASIGQSFFIDHGTGIVIGATTVIGNNVKIYQGVTLGAINVSKAMASIKRHPTIEDDVIIYAGATILGGETVIGNNSVIGGNVWLTYSVPPYSVVYQKNEIKVRDNRPITETFNFVI